MGYTCPGGRCQGENLSPQRSRSPQRFLREFLCDLCALCGYIFYKPTQLDTPKQLMMDYNPRNMFQSDMPNTRRRMTILAVIIATIPCYCVGFIALSIAPNTRITPTPTVTLSASEISPTVSATTAVFTTTITPTFTITSTSTVTVTPTATVSFTPFPPITFSPTFTNTPTHTATFTVTNTFTPSATFTITPSPTFTPTVTNTPTPSTTPSPTLTPLGAP